MELNERILETCIINELVRDNVPVTVTLINGAEFHGVVVNYDVLVLVLVTDDEQKILYKRHVASITPQRALKCTQRKS